MSTIDERLERIAALVESNTEHLAALHTITQIQSEHITSLRVAQQQYQQNFEVVQNEIKGLQLENRRILDHLFGQADGA
jgi:antirestriction protein